MQTFLPYPDFTESARCLDRQRLGKQRVEAMQLLRTLLEGGSWANHPAARMWRGYEGALLTYGLEVCTVWTERGYRDTCFEKMLELADEHGLDVSDGEDPPWLGDEAFHASHRSNLLRKYPDWYSQWGWTETDDLPYVWPVQDEGQTR